VKEIFCEACLKAYNKYRREKMTPESTANKMKKSLEWRKENYQRYKDYQRNYYHTVLKPKREAERDHLRSKKASDENSA